MACIASVLVRTNDDWHPSYYAGSLNYPEQMEMYVRVQLHDDEDFCAVTVWGLDDTGMERVFKNDLYGLNSVEAKEMFDQIIELKYASMSLLKSWGFDLV